MQSSNNELLERDGEPDVTEPAPVAAPPAPPAGLIMLEPAGDAGACSVDGWCN
ncbi:hypothetical protein ACQPZJ_05740 [Actinoplanes sp. CA-054009]